MIDDTNPIHYKALNPEPIDVIEGWDLGYHLGNVIKYIARYKNKGGIIDLKKSMWYLKRYIEYYEAEIDDSQDKK